MSAPTYVGKLEEGPPWRSVGMCPEGMTYAVCMSVMQTVADLWINTLLEHWFREHWFGSAGFPERASAPTLDDSRFELLSRPLSRPSPIILLCDVMLEPSVPSLCASPASRSRGVVRWWVLPVRRLRDCDEEPPYMLPGAPNR